MKKPKQKFEDEVAEGLYNYYNYYWYYKYYIYNLIGLIWNILFYNAVINYFYI